MSGLENNDSGTTSPQDRASKKPTSTTPAGKFHPQPPAKYMQYDDSGNIISATDGALVADSSPEDGLVKHSEYDHSADDGEDNTVALANKANLKPAPESGSNISAARIAAMLLAQQATSTEEAFKVITSEIANTQTSQISGSESSESTASTGSSEVGAKKIPPPPPARPQNKKGHEQNKSSLGVTTESKSDTAMVIQTTGDNAPTMPSSTSPSNKRKAGLPHEPGVNKSPKNDIHTEAKESWTNAYAHPLITAGEYSADIDEGGQFDDKTNTKKDKGGFHFHLPSFGGFSKKGKPKSDDQEEQEDPLAAEHSSAHALRPVLAKSKPPASSAHAPTSAFHLKAAPPLPPAGRAHNPVPSVNPAGQSVVSIPPPRPTTS